MTGDPRPGGVPPLTVAGTALLAVVFALSLAAVLALGGCRRVEPPAAIRLVERQEGASVRWPRARARRPPQGVTASPLGALPAPGAVREVVMYDDALDYDSRTALLLPQGGRYRFEVTPPPASELRLALGYVITGAAQGELRYRVRAAPRDGDEVGNFTTLLEETVDVETDGRWRERRISLADWGGRPIVLELRVTASGGGDLWAAFATPEILTPGAQRSGPDVILISLDTLRADHLSAYGYERPTSPNLDALAAGGYRFDTAVSQAPWTRPSHRSMLRGQYPLSHGPIEAPPLPLTLWRAGYRTAAFTGGGQMSFRFGFHEGFETFRQTDWVRSPSTVTDWIDADPERSFFLLLHTFEIHDPYDHSSFAKGLPSGRFRPGYGQKRWWSTRDTEYSQAEKDYVEALYDSGILFTDEALGRLFAALRERGLFERAIVIVTSDHGEQFWDHGSWRHGSNVYDEMLLVPLIVHLPPGLGAGEPGRIIRQQVALVDLVPTVLDLLDLPLPEGIQGRSLRPLLEGGEPAEPVPAFAEHTNISRESKALRAGRLKLIYSYPRSGDPLQPQAIELYDLDADPGETRNLARDQPPLARLLEAELKAILVGAPAPTFDEEVPADIDPQLRRELEALGYLDP
jgi:arylsulfatase A-like enzyme